MADEVPDNLAAEDSLPSGGASLCVYCEHCRRIASPKGSTFLLCQRSQVDDRFAKYPRQPVWQCGGFAATTTDTQ